MTEPAGTVVLEAVESPSPRLSPAAMIALFAAVCVRPTTFGTATCAVPLATCVPPVGVWLMTDPDGTVLLDAVLTDPIVRPAAEIADVAAVCVSPTTFGTATWDGPLETVKATALPERTSVPAPGFWLMTDPAGTVALDAVA